MGLHAHTVIDASTGFGIRETDEGIELIGADHMSAEAQEELAHMLLAWKYGLVEVEEVAAVVEADTQEVQLI